MAQHLFFQASIGRDAILRLDIDDEGMPTVQEYDIRLLDPFAVVTKKPKLRLFPQ